MKKIVMTVMMTVAVFGSSDDECRLYVDMLNSQSYTIEYKRKNNIAIYKYELETTKQYVALTMGHCNSNTKTQKAARRLAKITLRLIEIWEK